MPVDGWPRERSPRRTGADGLLPPADGKDTKNIMARKSDATITNDVDEEMADREPASDPDLAGSDMERRLQEAEQDAMRARAEVQNLKRRQREEIERIQDTATKSLVTDLLPVVDDLERALDSAGSTHNFEALRGGVELVLNKLQAGLKTVGVERMPGVGAAFDPNYHEAVQQLAPTDEFPNGTIAQELRPGYTQHGHVIRPSLVAVAHE
jgi:molecular chaperone GrpE